MKWCRFQIGSNIRNGLIEEHSAAGGAAENAGHTRVLEVAGSPFEAHSITRNSYALDEVKLLPPVIPPMLYVAGPNYRGHVIAMARRRGKEPQFPAKPEPNFRSVHALIGSGEAIIVPRDSCGAVQPEGQLAVVIGKKARRVSRQSALDYVFGYSIGNDITQREWQSADRTMFRSKNFDTFKPFGPWIVTGLDPAQLRIVVRHNGVVWQDFSPVDQIWDVATWISEMSKYSTLHPGDVLWMGAEGADGDMVPGDVIEVEVAGIGILRNSVEAETGDPL